MLAPRNEKTDLPYAGLVLPDNRGLDIRPYIAPVGDVLRRFDPHPTTRTIYQPDINSVVGKSYGVTLTSEAYSDFGPKVTLSVFARDGHLPDHDAATDVLAALVEKLLALCDADVVEWQAPDVLLNAKDFLTHRKGVPERPRFSAAELRDLEQTHAMRSALYEGVELTENAQANRFTSWATARLTQLATTPAAEHRLNLAGRIMTLLRVLVAQPIAAAMTVIGLTKGRDFRRTAGAKGMSGLLDSPLQKPIFQIFFKLLLK